MPRPVRSPVDDKFLFDKLLSVFNVGYINYRDLEEKVRDLLPLDKIKVYLDGELQGLVIGINVPDGVITQYDRETKAYITRKGVLKVMFDDIEHHQIMSPIWIVP